MRAVGLNLWQFPCRIADLGPIAAGLVPNASRELQLIPKPRTKRHYLN